MPDSTVIFSLISEKEIGMSFRTRKFSPEANVHESRKSEKIENFFALSRIDFRETSLIRAPIDSKSIVQVEFFFYGKIRKFLKFI